MALTISIFLFLALTGAISFYGYRRYSRPGGVFEQLGGKATVVSPIMGAQDQEDGLTVSIMEQIVERIPINPDDASILRRDLMMAGYSTP
jgi:hypothetical protein